MSTTTPHNEALEGQLIDRCLGGDHDAFYELMRPYERAVYFAAMGVVNNPADAEEVAQEAVLKAFNGLSKFRREAKFSTWLIQITINEARMKFRKDRKSLYESIDDQRSDEDGDLYAKGLCGLARHSVGSAAAQGIARGAEAGAGGSRSQVSRSLGAARCSTCEYHRNRQGSWVSRKLRSRLAYCGRDFKCAMHSRPVSMAHGRQEGLSLRKFGPGDANVGSETQQNLFSCIYSMVIEISCVEVWREVSNYIDETTDPELRSRMEAHFKVCKHCSAILDGTRNVVKLIADDAEFELPTNLGQRIYESSTLNSGSPDNRSP